MANIDLKNNTAYFTGFSPSPLTSNNTFFGNEIDTLGFMSVTAAAFLDSAVDGEFALSVYHSDESGGTFTQVGQDQLAGDLQDAILTAAGTTAELGYVGKKRFVKVAITTTNVTSGGVMYADIVLGSPRHAKVA